VDKVKHNIRDIQKLHTWVSQGVPSAKQVYTCKFYGFQRGVVMDSGFLGCANVSPGKWLPMFCLHHWEFMTLSLWWHNITSQKTGILKYWLLFNRVTYHQEGRYLHSWPCGSPVQLHIMYFVWCLLFPASNYDMVTYLQEGSSLCSLKDWESLHNHTQATFISITCSCFF
jgi:hypothetical protein